MTKLTTKQIETLKSLKSLIESGLAVELYEDCIVGTTATRHQIEALAKKGAIRLTQRQRSSYLSCATYGEPLVVEIV